MLKFNVASDEAALGKMKDEEREATSLSAFTGAVQLEAWLVPEVAQLLAQENTHREEDARGKVMAEIFARLLARVEAAWEAMQVDGAVAEAVRELKKVDALRRAACFADQLR